MNTTALIKMAAQVNITKWALYDLDETFMFADSDQSTDPYFKKEWFDQVMTFEVHDLAYSVKGELLIKVDDSKSKVVDTDITRFLGTINQAFSLWVLRASYMASLIFYSVTRLVYEILDFAFMRLGRESLELTFMRPHLVFGLLPERPSLLFKIREKQRTNNACIAREVC